MIQFYREHSHFTYHFILKEFSAGTVPAPLESLRDVKRTESGRGCPGPPEGRGFSSPSGRKCKGAVYGGEDNRSGAVASQT